MAPAEVDGNVVVHTGTIDEGSANTLLIAVAYGTCPIEHHTADNRRSKSVTNKIKIPLLITALRAAVAASLLSDEKESSSSS